MKYLVAAPESFASLYAAKYGVFHSGQLPGP